MNAVAIAMDALFADGNIGVEAIYTAGGDNPVLVRVVARRGDSVTGFGEAKLCLVLSQFRSGLPTHLGGLSFECQGAFSAQR